MTVFDDPKFVKRIHKYRECRLNKRSLLSHWSVIEKVTVKIKKIGVSNTQKRRKKKGENIEDERAEKINDLTKDKTIGIANTENFPAVVSLPTTENIMKHETLNDAKEAPEENNEGIIAETKDSIPNLPAVVGVLTTDIMKHEVDEAAVRKDVAGGDDVTEGDMEVVEAGERRDDAIKVIDSKSIDAEERDEEDAAIKVQREAAVKELLEKGEFNVSNGQEMNQSKDKPSTELIPDDTEILDKGGGRKDSSDGREGNYLKI